MIGSPILEQIPLSITVMSVGMKEISIQPNGASNARNEAIMTQRNFCPGQTFARINEKGVLEFFYTPFLEDQSL